MSSFCVKAREDPMTAAYMRAPAAVTDPVAEKDRRKREKAEK